MVCRVLEVKFSPPFGLVRVTVGGIIVNGASDVSVPT
jgi:hypothetical protein